MKWVKKGLIYGPAGEHDWAQHSALTPTPILVEPDTIRVYAGFRDDHGVSRIGFVDVNANDPSEVKNVSQSPALDIGLPGAFDDNGVILGDIVTYEEKLYLYYVGFQLVEKVKFLAFSGLAISMDKGNTFERYSHAPILDRGHDELFIRAIHSVIIENGVWKIWYAAGNGWQWINGVPYPKYHIRYLESPDGINFSPVSIPCIETENKEYRIGRPRVYQRKDSYLMFYTKGTLDGNYIAGYAESDDGKKWVRKDSEMGLTLSATGWDSLSVCYPSLLKYKDQVYLFYNGNHMGRDGFGYAVLAQ